MATANAASIHGDPAITINDEKLPDYDIEAQNVRISPTFISVSDNSFNVSATFYNLGKAISDSITILFTRKYPDGSTSTLLKQLQSVSGALSNSTVLPILENFLFEIKDGNLTISATDLQTSMTTSLTVEAKDNGRIAIPSRILLDTLKSLPEQPIAFSVDDKTFAIEINAGDGKYKLSGENGEDFPKIPVVENASSVNLPASVLAEAINKTIFAVSNDELRPAMTGGFGAVWAP